jgi:hypothetical protein
VPSRGSSHSTARVRVSPLTRANHGSKEEGAGPRPSPRWLLPGGWHQEGQHGQGKDREPLGVPSDNGRGEAVAAGCQEQPAQEGVPAGGGAHDRGLAVAAVAVGQDHGDGEAGELRLAEGDDGEPALSAITS